jgi:hypothetical protein
MVNGRDQCVFGETPWIAGPSPAEALQTLRVPKASARVGGSSPAMTSLFVVAAPLRTRVLLTPRKAKPKSIPKKSPLLKEGRRSADRRVQDPHQEAMRRASFLLSSLRKNRGPGLHREPWTSRSGRARLSAPHRGIRGFGLGSARAALPGTTGCKREDPLRHQCSEHLAVRHLPNGTMPKPPVSAVYRRAAREPLPLRPKEYPRERRPFASGILVR